MKKLALGCIFILQIFFCLPLQAKEPIILWHALAGHLGTELNQLVNQFNQSQADYDVIAVYKGNYIETLTSFAAAFRAKQSPDIVQVFEVGTATMLAPKGIIKPLHQLLKEQNQSIATQDFIPNVRRFYSINDKLMAFPLSISVPVMYYNLDALHKAGYTEKQLPDTWQSFEKLARALKKSGYRCAYTTAHPAWIHVESFLSLHGIDAYTADSQKAIFNQFALKKHFNRLKTWQKKGYFRYGGRFDDATSLFTSGICPIFSQSSGGFNSLSKMLSSPLVIGPMPIDSELIKTARTNVAGGAALWVSSQSPAIKAPGIAQFFTFISQTNIQQHWHEQSGYLPVGLTGRYADITAASQHPALTLAIQNLTEAEQGPAMNNQVPQHQIRTANEEAMESLFSGIKSVEQSLNEAESKANHLIRRYRKNTTA